LFFGILNEVLINHPSVDVCSHDVINEDKEDERVRIEQLDSETQTDGKGLECWVLTKAAGPAGGARFPKGEEAKN
jgi:anti-sigma-K factor RskA